MMMSRVLGQGSNKRAIIDSIHSDPSSHEDFGLYILQVLLLFAVACRRQCFDWRKAADLIRLSSAESNAIVISVFVESKTHSNEVVKVVFKR